MPTNWADKVRAAITNLETKADRVLEPDQALALIDDVVEGKFAAGDLATIRDIPQESLRITLGQITRAVGAGRVRSLANGGWYELQSDEQPYRVALRRRLEEGARPAMTEQPCCPRSGVLFHRRANDRWPPWQNATRYAREQFRRRVASAQLARRRAA
jgi:hypothetical protein